MKKIVWGIGGIILVAGLFTALHTYYLYTHRKFGIADFSHPFILREEKFVKPEDGLKEEARQLLNQPFSYLGYGGQMTAYASADGRFVIKFLILGASLKKVGFSSGVNSAISIHLSGYFAHISRQGKNCVNSFLVMQWRFKI